MVLVVFSVAAASTLFSAVLKSAFVPVLEARSNFSGAGGHLFLCWSWTLRGCGSWQLYYKCCTCLAEVEIAFI